MATALSPHAHNRTRSREGNQKLSVTPSPIKKQKTGPSEETTSPITGSVFHALKSSKEVECVVMEPDVGDDFGSCIIKAVDDGNRMLSLLYLLDILHILSPFLRMNQFFTCASTFRSEDESWCYFVAKTHSSLCMYRSCNTRTCGDSPSESV
jgi:hypothetical protein